MTTTTDTTMTVAEAGRKGRRVNSEAQAAASRANGAQPVKPGSRQRGRPRKNQEGKKMADRTQNKMEIKFAADWVKRACADYGIKATWFRVLDYSTDAKGDLVEVGNTKRTKVFTDGDRRAYSM